MTPDPISCGILHPLQLWEVLHRRNCKETGDKDEEDKYACEKGLTERSAIPEHAGVNTIPLRGKRQQ